MHIVAAELLCTYKSPYSLSHMVFVIKGSFEEKP